jgi:hypothetical protein
MAAVVDSHLTGRGGCLLVQRQFIQALPQPDIRIELRPISSRVL